MPPRADRDPLERVVGANDDGRTAVDPCPPAGIRALADDGESGNRSVGDERDLPRALGEALGGNQRGRRSDGRPGRRAAGKHESPPGVERRRQHGLCLLLLPSVSADGLRRHEEGPGKRARIFEYANGVITKDRLEPTGVPLEIRRTRIARRGQEESGAEQVEDAVRRRGGDRLRGENVASSRAMESGQDSRRAAKTEIVAARRPQAVHHLEVRAHRDVHHRHASAVASPGSEEIESRGAGKNVLGADERKDPVLESEEIEGGDDENDLRPGGAWNPAGRHDGDRRHSEGDPSLGRSRPGEERSRFGCAGVRPHPMDRPGRRSGRAEGDQQRRRDPPLALPLERGEAEPREDREREIRFEEEAAVRDPGKNRKVLGDLVHRRQAENDLDRREEQEQEEDGFAAAAMSECERHEEDRHHPRVRRRLRKRDAVGIRVRQRVARQESRYLSERMVSPGPQRSVDATNPLERGTELNEAEGGGSRSGEEEPAAIRGTAAFRREAVPR